MHGMYIMRLRRNRDYGGLSFVYHHLECVCVSIFTASMDSQQNEYWLKHNMGGKRYARVYLWK